MARCGFLALVALSLLAIPLPVRAVETQGIARAVDGDTLVLGRLRIRLWGIDAPERAQICQTISHTNWPCGAKARTALAGLIARRPVACRSHGRDDYGRMVASCTVGGHDIGGWLVLQGWALDYPRYSGGAHAALERTARAARRNIWAGTMLAPSKWRQQQRQRMAVGTRAGACPFKGNIGAAGKRIVHVPGQRDYAAVKIDPVRGERWFCSLGEAQAAGWRPAVR
ncbi:thermonuclease family protein [Sphingomonas crocodyli]|uniref:Thermonuclease family protein n=1 Tax=Sphingomonas crocodyli TaxID=1979270 RepID=A0A437LY36_9SPHN|nr:thermonuclease family protein [Sphingomonas crocodyli]RVT90311.1 thermonuclease family protein [Sphingomonas crocodyli]